MSYVAKAYVGGAAAFLTALLAEWTGGHDPLEARDFVVALLGAVTTFSVVYATPNRPRAAR